MSDHTSRTCLPPEPPFSDSDLQWLAALSGQADAGPDSPSAREGRLLRDALDLHAAEQAEAAQGDLAPVSTDDALEAQFQALLRRARAEGLLPATSAETAAAPSVVPTDQPAPGTVALRPVPPVGAGSALVVPPWRRPVLWGGLAAGLLATVLLGQSGLLREQGRIYGPPMQTSGTEGRQMLRVAQPRQTAEALAAQLGAAGLKNGLFQDGRRFGVDVNLTAADLATAAPAFGAIGLQPAIGFNRVQFEPR